MHLCIRSGNELSAILTVDADTQIDLGKHANADGFKISGLDTVAVDRNITLSCAIVLDDLDVEINTLKAHLVDVDGNSITVEQISEAMRSQVEAAGATVDES